MTIENDFLPFAGASGANVVSQRTYAGSAWQETGFVSGIALSNQLNKVWRQASIIASVIAQYINQETDQNTIDDGTTATLLANFTAAIQAASFIKLQADTTYYVNGSTGNDNNTGTSATVVSGNIGPWATIQHAITWTQQNVHANGFTITWQIANGTYTGFACTAPFMGQTGNPNQFMLLGNTATPLSVIVSQSNGNAAFIGGGAVVTLNGMTLQATGTGSNGNGLVCYNGGQVTISNIYFNACATNHINCEGGFVQWGAGSYTIAGGANNHILSTAGGNVSINSATITLASTPAFLASGGGFADAQLCGIIQVLGVTFSGTGATGARYLAIEGGQINTAGAGSTYLPGNSSGTATSPGGYY